MTVTSPAVSRAAALSARRRSAGSRSRSCSGWRRCCRSWCSPNYLLLASQIAITALFALSLDLILGYAGIVSLGHAAFFGFGAYTAGLLAKRGWGEPLTGLLIAAARGRPARLCSRASSSRASAISR